MHMVATPNIHTPTTTQKTVVWAVVLGLHLAIIGLLAWVRVPALPITPVQALSVTFIDSPTPSESSSSDNGGQMSNLPKADLSKQNEPRPSTPKPVQQPPIMPKTPLPKPNPVKSVTPNTTAQNTVIHTEQPTKFSVHTPTNNEKLAEQKDSPKELSTPTTAKTLVNEVTINQANPTPNTNPKNEQATQTAEPKTTNSNHQTTNKDNNSQNQNQAQSHRPTNGNTGEGIADSQSLTTGTGKGSTSASDGDSNSPNLQAVESSWASKVRAKIERSLNYPDEALSKKWGGKATLKITIDGNGNVLSVEVAKSSGKSILDNEAIATARRASPLPKPPSEIMRGQASRSFSIPVNFDYKKYR